LESAGDVVGASISGDAAYDPAAGGLGRPGTSIVTFGPSSDEFGECLVSFLPTSC